MSMSALLSALRGAGRRQVSASTIGVRRATGSHVLRINGYTKVCKTVPNGEDLKSGTFSVGGHDWRILCYPNGDGHDDKGSISLFLEHASHGRTGDATAKAEMSILPGVTAKLTHTKTTVDYRFTKKGGWGWGDFIKHDDLDKEKYLKDDCLTILCDVTVTEPSTDDHIETPSPESTVVEPPRTQPPPPFISRGQLLEAIWNIKKVDVNIEVAGETFPAHRWVLEAQSPVFRRELWLTSTYAGTTKLRVDDMDAEVFRALLRFIYTDSPPETSLLEEATFAEKLLVGADRFELEDLKRICEDALCPHIGINSLAATLALAERHRCSVLEAACMEFLYSPGNLEAVVAAGGIEQMKKGCPIALSKLVEEKI